MLFTELSIAIRVRQIRLFMLFLPFTTDIIGAIVVDGATIVLVTRRTKSEIR